MIGILDYGIGNPRSILRMCETSGMEAQIVSHEEKIMNSARLVLPGVGSFDSCALALRSNGLDALITHLVREREIPLLGICVGAQLLGVASEEGSEPGLGLMSHSTVRLRPTNQPVPHMGWKYVEFQRSDLLGLTFNEQPRFYFSHSYVIHASDIQDRFGTFHYETNLDALLVNNNMVAVQFHPEKSHKFGRRLLEWFGTWTT